MYVKKEEVSRQASMAVRYENALALRLDEHESVGSISDSGFRWWCWTNVEHRLPREARKALKVMLQLDLSYLPNRTQVVELIRRYDAWPADLASASEEEVITADEKTFNPSYSIL